MVSTSLFRAAGKRKFRGRERLLLRVRCEARDGVFSQSRNARWWRLKPASGFTTGSGSYGSPVAMVGLIRAHSVCLFAPRSKPDAARCAIGCDQGRTIIGTVAATNAADIGISGHIVIAIAAAVLFGLIGLVPLFSDELKATPQPEWTVVEGDREARPPVDGRH